MARALDNDRCSGAWALLFKFSGATTTPIRCNTVAEQNRHTASAAEYSILPEIRSAFGRALALRLVFYSYASGSLELLVDWRSAAPRAMCCQP